MNKKIEKTPTKKAVTKPVQKKQSGKKVVNKNIQPAVVEKEPVVQMRVVQDIGTTKSKARKLNPKTPRELMKNIVDICSHAYGVQAPKDKDIIDGDASTVCVNIFPVKMKCNWSKFLHKTQVEMYVKHLANKLGYIEAGFKMEESEISVTLIGPFSPSLLQETF